MIPFDRAKCLVLGGGGFIGTHLCRALVEAGAQVTVFGRQRPHPEALRSTPFICAEFSNESALASAVDGQHYVFHLLGGITPENSNRNPIADLTANTLATLQLLEICRAFGGPKVIFASSGGTVYGIPSRVPIQENAATDPICAYGVSKLSVEKYLGVYCHVHGLPYVVLRIANPFGPWQRPGRGQGLIATLLQRALHGEQLEIWGDGKIVRDFLYVEDVVAAVLGAALYRGTCRIFNVGSGVGRSVRDVVADIGRLVGQPHITTVHKAARSADVPINVLDIGLIHAELGWCPRVPWADGLQRTAEWMASAPQS